MVATQLHCPQCAAVQRAAVAALLHGERSLGVTVSCGRCGYLAFTMLKAARIYCGVCDEVRPAVLKSVTASEAKVLVCGNCLNAKATLYGERASST
jgi:ribosomal protein S27AE